MKKYIIPFVILFTLVLAVIYTQISRKPLKDISVSDMKEIYICDSAENMLTLKEDKDKSLVLDFLKKMHLKWEMSNELDGFGFIIKLKSKNGDTIECTLRGKDVVIDNKFYKTDQDYCNGFREIFKTLSKK